MSSVVENKDPVLLRLSEDFEIENIEDSRLCRISILAISTLLVTERFNLIKRKRDCKGPSVFGW
jgi:hypothetical protein